jgi:hypothetical protein
MSSLTLLSRDTEAQLLMNLLADEDDFLSQRLLTLHYQAVDLNTSAAPTNEDEV